MNWAHSLDAYCERLGPGFWAEPLNAASNLAFLLVAIWAWQRGPGFWERALAGVLALIALGSTLLHTFATTWAAASDILPIALFILVYLYVTNRDIIGLGSGGALFATSFFIPYFLSLVPFLAQVPFIDISAFYWPTPILMLGYAVLLMRRAPDTSAGFAIGAFWLTLSILLRSLDAPLCDEWPAGTHFGWHLLNALVLGWMIEVYRRHRLRRLPLATGRAGG